MRHTAIVQEPPTAVKTRNVKLSKPALLLACLQEHAGQHPSCPVPHRQLVASVWGASYLATDYSNLLRTTVTAARQLAGSRSYIRLKRRAGYYWAGPIADQKETP